MKYIKYILLFLVIGASEPSFSQSKSQKGDKIVFLLRQKEHIIQAVKTVVSLKESKISTVKPLASVIIVCGDAVKDLINADMLPLLKIASEHHILVYACGLSLTKFEISKDQLPPSVLYVENGLIKTLELQKKGYLSIEL